MATKPESSPRTRRPPSTDPASAERPALVRALPHDDDAERAVLGCMLLEREAIGEAVTVLRGVGAEAFFHEHHRLLYQVLVDLYDRNVPIDAVLIKDELVRRGLFERLGGFEFLTRLASAVGTALRVRAYAGLVLEKHLLRHLIGANHRVMEAAFDEALPTQQILDFAEAEVFKVTEQRVSGGPLPIADLIREVWKQIETRGERILTGEPSGFLLLDELTSGFQPGELIIVAARPSMGKTALGLNIAEHLAVVEQRAVLFFSLEMNKQSVTERLLCSLGRVDSHRLRRGRLNATELARLQDAAAALVGKPLFIDDSSGLSVLELRARARMMKRRHDLRAVFVDYLQLMNVPGAENRQVEVATISRGLKALAKELNLPVIAMAQLNRNPEERGAAGNRPRMSDLRESGAIEQDADVIILLHRESYYRKKTEDADEDNTAELIVAKQRNGPTDSVKVVFNMPYTRFDNLKLGGFGGSTRSGFDSGGEPPAPF